MKPLWLLLALSAWAVKGTPPPRPAPQRARQARELHRPAVKRPPVQAPSTLWRGR